MDQYTVELTGWRKALDVAVNLLIMIAVWPFALAFMALCLFLSLTFRFIDRKVPPGDGH